MKGMQRRRRLGAMLCGGIALILPAPVFSQTSASEEADRSDEIVVTARLREQPLQDVPISVAVVGAEQIAEQNLTSLESLSRNIPSINITGTVGRSGALFIRGVGSGNNPAFDQSVSTFVDGVYHGRARMSANTFLDIERVEILRGPQSTFFGHNAIAGALNVITHKSGKVLEASARALYGEDRQYAFEGAVGGPLSDTVGARAAVTFNGLGGWLRNVTTGKRAPNQDNMAGRLTLSFQPSSQFDAMLKVEGSRNRDSGLISRIANCPPPAPFTTPRGFCPIIISTGSPTGFHDLRFARNPGEEIRLDAMEAALTLNYHVGDHVITAISGYYDYDYNLNLDADVTPVQLINVQAPEKYHQFSQELRLTSPAGGTIEYVAGGYFQTSRLKNDTRFNFGVVTNPINATPVFAPLRPYLPLGQVTSFTQDETVLSAFGSLTWHMAEALRFNAGLRYSRVRKSFDWQLFYGTATQPFGGIVPLPAAVATLPNLLGLGTAGVLAGKRTDDAWMPSAQLQYDLAPDVMLYGSYSRGFKAGGFNYADISAVFANMPFAPETVNAFEIGLKSQFGRQLTLNLAAFRADYHNLQSAATIANAAGAYVSIVNNASASVSQGVEVEMNWVPNRNFRLSASGTYLDSHYSDYRNAPPTAFQQLQLAQCLAATPAPATACNIYRSQDISGKSFPYAPRWSGSVTGAYSLDIGDDKRVTAEVTGRFASRQQGTPNADALGIIDGYGRLDARLTFEFGHGRWALDLIGENLTNKVIVTAGGPMAGSSLGSIQFHTQQPRNIAVQARFKL